MSSTPRKRKQQASKSETTVEPMDETEQQQVVDSLRADALEQIELVHGIFSRVCGGAIMLCLILGVTTGDVWGWMHVFLAVFLHWGAIRIAVTAKPGNNTTDRAGFHKYLPFLVLLTLLGVFLPMILQQNTAITDSIKPAGRSKHDDYMHHGGLALSNVVTMLGALYLKYDSQSTKKALAELEQSQYKHKSL